MAQVETAGGDKRINRRRRHYGTAIDRLRLGILRFSLVGAHRGGRHRIFSALSQLGIFQKSYLSGFSFPNVLWQEWGYSQEEMQRDGWRKALHPDDRDLIEAALEDQFSSSDRIELPEYRIVTKTGEVRWILSKGVVVERDSRGNVAHYIGADFDITRRKIAEERIDTLRRRENRLLAESRHRFKNQLISLKHRVDELADSAEKDSVRSQDLLSLSSRIRAIQELNECLSSGDLRRSPRVDTIVERISSATAEVYGSAANVELTRRVETMEGDRETVHALALVLHEILTNAYKHAFPAGGPGRITIDLRLDEERQINLTVTDDGTGYPVHNTTRSTGGIAQSRELLANIGGAIEIRPNSGNGQLPQGGGTEVIITVPGVRR